MLQIFHNTAQSFKTIALAFAGMAALSLHPAAGSPTGEDHAASTEDAVAYFAALEELKSDYADQQAFNTALKELAGELAAKQNDLFETPSKAKVFNSDFEFVAEFPLEEEAIANDEDKLMVYNNTAYYIK